MEIYSGKKRSIYEKDDIEEKELYEFDDESDDDNDYDNESNPELSASDIEDEQRGDYVPDQKAWGNKRNQYYDADFVDKDYDTYTKEEEEQAIAEEQEAQEIQRRLAQQLTDIDCDLELFGLPKKDKDDENIFETKADFSNLGNKEKLQIFKKESPEFEGLVADFENNINEMKDFYTPLLGYAKIKNIDLPIFKMLQARASATNFYITNMAFYLYMKVKKINFKNHPIVKKLAQIKQLLNELDQKISNQRDQLTNLISRIHESEDFICISSEQLSKNKQTQETQNEDIDENGDMNEENVGDDDQRRGITYQMSKNKGLIPHRKKENRNPRVKHRMKFRKALIRRKGAVRTVRKETKRYDGELFGIKATVRKSVKLK